MKAEATALAAGDALANMHGFFCGVTPPLS